MQNPTSRKVLLTYEKTICDSQEQFQLSLDEIAEEPSPKGKKRDVLTVIENVIKNLNRDDLADDQDVSPELVREDKQRYLIIGQK
jgi:hypothetical protein